MEKLGSPTSINRLAKLFRALGSPTRLLILRQLTENQAYCGDLVELTGLAQSTVSHHLKVLREAGLVTSQPEGTATCFRANDQTLSELSEALSRLRGLSWD